MAFLLAVPAADVAVVVAVSVASVAVAVVAVWPSEVTLLEGRHAGTTTDGVDSFELVIVEEVSGKAGQLSFFEVLHLAGRDASGQRGSC